MRGITNYLSTAWQEKPPLAVVPGYWIKEGVVIRDIRRVLRRYCRLSMQHELTSTLCTMPRVRGRIPAAVIEDCVWPTSATGRWTFGSGIYQSSEPSNW